MGWRPPRLVIELGRRRLRAIEAASSGGASVHRVVDVEMPGDLAVDDAAAVGAWMSSVLDAGGLSRGPSILSLPRDTVVARRLLLPTRDAAEIPEMARLAMLRELPVDGGEAAIDHVEISRDEAGTTVFAVAILQRTLEAMAERCTLAGRPPACALPRMLGTAALAAACRSGEEPLLVVDVLGDAVELLVLDAAAGIGFSRGAPLRTDIDAPGDVASDGALASGETAGRDQRSTIDAVVAEVKRSWLGHRMSSAADQTSSEVRAVAVIADPAVRRPIEGALSSATGLAPSPVETVRVLTSSRELRTCAPLAGFLLAGCKRIDLLHPRKPPDLAARRRQMVLAAVGLLVLAGLLGFTLGKREARDTEARREDIAQKARGALSEGWRLRRDEDKLRHVAQWTQPSEDWLEDFLYVKELLPEPGDVVLDTVAASQEFSGVKIEKPAAARTGSGAAAPPDGSGGSGGSGGAGEGAAAPTAASSVSAGSSARQPRWVSSSEVRIVLEGEAKTRAIADALREKLIADSRFSVTTSGSDTRGGNRLPYPFGYLLRTQRSAPPVGDPKSAGTASNGAASGPSAGGAAGQGDAS